MMMVIYFGSFNDFSKLRINYFHFEIEQYENADLFMADCCNSIILLIKFFLAN